MDVLSYFNIRHPLYVFRSIYFTTKASGFKLQVHNEEISCEKVDELCSNQEEADTKVFLAAKLAQDVGCSDIGIFTVDSDVAILACFYATRLNSRLFVTIGSGNNIRILNVSSNEWSSEVLKCLPALHAILGCDAVSAFNGIGKRKWLTKLEDNEEFLHTLDTLGNR